MLIINLKWCVLVSHQYQHFQSCTNLRVECQPCMANNSIDRPLNFLRLGICDLCDDSFESIEILQARGPATKPSFCRRSNLLPHAADMSAPVRVNT